MGFPPPETEDTEKTDMELLKHVNSQNEQARWGSGEWVRAVGGIDGLISSEKEKHTKGEEPTHTKTEERRDIITHQAPRVF